MLRFLQTYIGESLANIRRNARSSAAAAAAFCAVVRREGREGEREARGVLLAFLQGHQPAASLFPPPPLHSRQLSPPPLPVCLCAWWSLCKALRAAAYRGGGPFPALSQSRPHPSSLTLPHTFCVVSQGWDSTRSLGTEQHFIKKKKPGDSYWGNCLGFFGWFSIIVVKSEDAKIFLVSSPVGHVAVVSRLPKRSSSSPP